MLNEIKLDRHVFHPIPTPKALSGLAFHLGFGKSQPIFLLIVMYVE